jgi:hypothetical protein
MSAKRARDLVESHPYDRGSYTKHDPRMEDPSFGNGYVALLATIQVHLDRVNTECLEPNPVEIMALREIAKLAEEASRFKSAKLFEERRKKP